MAVLAFQWDTDNGTCDTFQRHVAKVTCGPFGLFMVTRLRVHVTLFKGTWLRTHVDLLAFSKRHG